MVNNSHGFNFAAAFANRLGRCHLLWCRVLLRCFGLHNERRGFAIWCGRCRCWLCRCVDQVVCCDPVVLHRAGWSQCDRCGRAMRNGNDAGDGCDAHRAKQYDRDCCCGNQRMDTVQCFMCFHSCFPLQIAIVSDMSSLTEASCGEMTMEVCQMQVDVTPYQLRTRTTTTFGFQLHRHDVVRWCQRALASVREGFNNPEAGG